LRQDKEIMNMATNEPLAIVLAAGKGTRMNSDLPKVLCPVLGRPMIHFVIDALNQAGVQNIVVVVGYRAEDVQNELADREGLEFIEQTEQHGTGHAVMMCREVLRDRAGPVLIVAGDSPLMQSQSLATVLDEFRDQQPACLLGTLHKDDPYGLGRIVRDAEGQFSGIVEEKDATAQQRLVTEVNMSTYVFEAGELTWALEKITNKNTQKEYYLTDCPGILKDEGKVVIASPVLRPCESLSINTLEELAIVEAEMKKLGY